MKSDLKVIKKIVGDEITLTSISRVVACWGGCFGISGVQWMVCKYHGSPCPSPCQQQASHPQQKQCFPNSLLLACFRQVCWGKLKVLGGFVGFVSLPGQGWGVLVRVLWGRWGAQRGSHEEQPLEWCCGHGTAQMWPVVVWGFTDGLPVSAEVLNQWLLGSCSLRKELPPGPATGEHQTCLQNGNMQPAALLCLRKQMVKNIRSSLGQGTALFFSLSFSALFPVLS